MSLFCAEQVKDTNINRLDYFPRQNVFALPFIVGTENCELWRKFSLFSKPYRGKKVKASNYLGVLQFLTEGLEILAFISAL